MKVKVGSERELEDWVRQWLQQLGEQELILLEGPLGVGKTRLVRAVVEQLKGKWVSSPSFAIIQRYPCEKLAVDHVDLYRMKNMADLDSTGFWDLFDQSQARIFVEWANLIPEKYWPR